MDIFLLQRNYQKVIESIEKSDDLYHQIIKIKCQLLLTINDTNQFLADDALNIQQLTSFYQCENIYIMDIESTKYQLLQFMRDDQTIMKQVFENELTYNSFEPYLEQLTKLPQNDLCRKISWLETIYRLIQSPKQKKSNKFRMQQELFRWQKYFIDIVIEIQHQQDYYKILRKPLKELYRLSFIQLLTLLDNQIDIFFQKLYIMLNNKLQEYLDNSIRITILYTIAKMIFPKIDSNDQLPKYYDQILTILIQHDKINSVPTIKTWLEMFDFIIFLMISEINLKKEHIFSKKLEDKIKNEQVDLPFIDQLWYYVSINFTQQIIKLNQSIKNLISHNVYSFINIYGIKYNKLSLMTEILEDLLITPFEDDILRMNMCIILFNNHEFTKLHQLVQSLLTSEQIKEHEFRPIIISLCVIFTGFYLEKAEEALCFARMNYNDYNKGIITMDTLLAQIGYCYYNLGKNSKYVTEKQHFYTKALEYLEKSVEENYQNHLVQYNYGKLLAITGEIDAAFYQVDEACKKCGSEIYFKILRAILFQTKHDNQTALKIISSLILLKPTAFLYFVKGSIMAETYLQNEENDKELQYSSKMSKELHEFIIKRNQKSKDMQSIILNFKKSLLEIVKQNYENEQNEQFISKLPNLKSLQTSTLDPIMYINYRNCIFNTIDVLIKLKLFDIAIQLLQLIDDGNETNETEKLFYQGIIQEKQGDIDKASQLYEEVLRSDFYHVRSMSKLALLYLKYFQNTKSQRANELLIAASKFEKTHEICLGLAILNQLHNNQVESQYLLNEALKLIKTSPVVSFQMIPDKLFF